MKDVSMDEGSQTVPVEDRKRSWPKGGEKVVRNWRIIGSDNSGFYCYFDPRTESIMIRDLTVPEQLDRIEDTLSVSALVEGGGEPSQMDLFRMEVEHGVS